jgi:FlaA1/EpsC-like NDP-sugar epimerase
MVDRDESALHAVQLSIEGRALLDSPDLVLLDIRDQPRLARLFAERRPEVVFHAAALKHQPLLERPPGRGGQDQRLGHAGRPRGCRHHPRWERRYALGLVAIDLVAVNVAAALAQLLRFGFAQSSLTIDSASVSYVTVAGVLVPLWLVVMAIGGGYEPRAVGTGSEEFRRVFNAAVRFLAVVAIVFYAARIDVDRAFIAFLILWKTVNAVLRGRGAY